MHSIYLYIRVKHSQRHRLYKCTSVFVTYIGGGFFVAVVVVVVGGGGGDGGGVGGFNNLTI